MPYTADISDGLRIVIRKTGSDRPIVAEIDIRDSDGGERDLIRRLSRAGWLAPGGVPYPGASVGFPVHRLG